MIHINKIIGNINSDSDLHERYQTMMKNDKVEKIQISRLEADRTRIRKLSNKGTDLALTMEPSSHINDGDVVLLTEEKMIIAKRESENVVIISLNNDISSQQILELAINIRPRRRLAITPSRNLLTRSLKTTLPNGIAITGYINVIATDVDAPTLAIAT